MAKFNITYTYEPDSTLNHVVAAALEENVISISILLLWRI